ncbi:MAG: cache domain-containing protein, partial [Proteobacteria bacterium]|nr:cache domain-containing protein [Pseudomonadota bacterium]
MRTLTFDNPSIAGRYALPVYFVLIAAGLAGNYFKYPIFLNIDFLFGSIFAMLALQFFGPARGIAAAALIAAVTYFIWSHPYAILIMTAEVAAVGWLVSRYKLGLVLADALYWLFAGMPLVYLFHHGVMDVILGNTTIEMIKQAVNGITNALLARLIYTGFVLRSRTALIAYRDLIYNLLTVFALFPALILLMVASRSEFTETDRSIRTELHHNSLSMTNRIEVWLQNRSTAIIHLAKMAATLTPQQMQVRLEQADADDVNLERIGLLNREATVTAISPQRDELGQPNIGKNFADRPFIPRLKQTLKPMLSEVVMARVGKPEPVVSLLAPVVIEGEYGGYIIGILSLEQLRNYLEKSAESSTMLYTLLDKNSNIILTNRQEQKMMTSFVRGQGSLNRLDERISQWVPTLPPNIPISERWKASFYVAET